MSSINKRVVSIIHQKFRYPGLRLGDQIQVHWIAQIATVCTGICYFSQVVAFCLTCQEGVSDKLFDSIIMIAFYGVGILKLSSLRRNHKHWYSLLKTVEQVEEYEQRLDNQHLYDSQEQDGAFSFKEYIRAYTNKCFRVSETLPKIYIGPLFIHIIGPYVEFAYRRASAESYEALAWPHLVPCWAVLDKYSFAAYWATIFIEIVTAFYCIFNHIAFDTISFSTMIFADGQFSLLRDYSENIGNKNQNMRMTKKCDDFAHSRIINCHKLYISTKNVVKELRMLLGNILGVYFFMVTVLLCFVAVRINNNETTVIQLATLFQYMGASLTQLYMYCYFGDKVFNSSTVGMGEGPFGAAYWSLSPRLKRELIILGVTMAQPCRLRAGPFMFVDLPSFIMVVRAAYSYYAFIRQ